MGLVRVPHPDLILRVTTADNRLRFDLDFADTRFVQIEGDRLRADPETFRYNLLKEIEGLTEYVPAPADLTAVEDLLRGDLPIQLWHLACHVSYSSAVPRVGRRWRLDDSAWVGLGLFFAYCAPFGLGSLS
jgi:hypothetical protein